MDLKETREFWKVAANFPPDKETVYPAHAAAHCFDVQGQPGKQVLEYGCGGGSDTMSLARRGATVVYVDVVPENIQQTSRRIAAGPMLAGTAIGYVLDDSDALPFEAALFDSVNCHGVLHHIEEKLMGRVIDEFYRALKPGGMLYAMLYTEHLFNRCMTQIEGLRAQGWSVERAFSYCTDGGGIARAYSLGGGRELFEAHGFEFVSAVEYNDADFRTFRVKRP